ncbi:MAG: hypothetical protein IJ142_07895 [Bacteroidaceae bacterium]|nr:hypothetical protein [Bacteroidaceae bacterium]MBQ9191499.1 hypothetical protein [Bacteroidaceae bacterium]
MKELSFSDAPHNWAICFQTDCPLGPTCLRHRVAELAPEHMMRHVMVMPSAREGEQCREFVSAEPVRMGWGMKSTFAGVKSYHYQEMRPLLESYFGSHTTFYRYYNGIRPITPDHQAWIAKLLKRFGYNAPLRFDREEEVYDFTTK